MAYRTWGRVLLAALGVGLLAGAGQLGFAYGLGVVRFARDFEQLPGQWAAHLAWVAWFATLAAVAGGLAGNWLAARNGLASTIGTRVAVAVAGGVGALAVAPLAMLPSRAAAVTDGNPVTIAGLSAALGALVGVFAAVAVLSQRVAGLNLAAITVVVWLVALLSVAPSLGPDDPLPEVRLGVLDATWLGDGLAQRLAVIVMPAIALAVGAGIGALARWRGLPLIPVAVSGVVGPALLALAYLIAGPGDDADRYQAAPYWGALIAVAAGGLGSVLAAVARQLTAGGDGALGTGGGPSPRHGDHTAEVFPGYGADDTAVTTDPTGDAADEPTRPGGFDAWTGDKPAGGGGGQTTRAGGFDAWAGDEPAAGGGQPTRAGGFDAWTSDKPAGGGGGDGEPRRRWGDDNPTSSFGRTDLDSAAGRSGDDLFGNRGAGADRDPLGGSGSSFGSARGERDGPGGGGAGYGRERGGDGEARGAFADAPGDEFGSRRARDLDEAERPGSAPSGASLFNPPTPVAQPRQPEIVSPPPGPEPTPVRPFDRLPTTGPGDWRDDKTSTFTAPSVPVVPAPPAGGTERRDDGDVHQRPTSIRPRLAPGRASGPADAGGTGGLAPIDLPDQAGAAGSGRAGAPGAGRAGGADWPAAGRSGEPGRETDWRGRPASTGGPSDAGEEMPDWRLAPPAWTPPPPVTPGQSASGPGAGSAMPSRDITSADAAGLPTEATPAKAPEQKRRGLFRRKNKSAQPDPAPSGPAADSGWVEVPAATGPATGSGTDQAATDDEAPTGPRGFGFGGLVKGRFGKQGRAAGDSDAEPDRDTGTPDSRRDSSDLGQFDRDLDPPDWRTRDSDRRSVDRDKAATDPRAGDTGSRNLDRDPDTSGPDADDTGSRSWPARAGADDAGSRSWPARADGGDAGSRSWAERGGADDAGSPSWAARAGADDDGSGSWATRAGADTGADDDRTTTDAAAAGPSAGKDRAGRKPGRAERHLRSVDLGGEPGDDRPDRPATRGDAGGGSWDIDDPAPAPTRATRSHDDAKTAGDAKTDDDAKTADDTEPDAQPAPSRTGLFRRNRNTADTAETDAEPPTGDAPEPSRGRRGKGEKPIRERDEEYVDWVTGLSAPEPVNERRRDDTPRRSLRSARRKDE